MSGFARRLQQAAANGSPAIAGNVLAQDNFNRADGNLGTADIGGAWTTNVGALTGTPAWGITGDAVAVTAAGGTDNWLSATLPLSVPTGTIFCDFYLSPTNANTGLCVWSSTDGNTYLNIQLNESDTYDRIALSKRVAGTTTWLQEQDGLNFGNGVGYSAAVVFTAANVKVYLDGQQYIDYDLTAQDQTDLAGGTYPGLRSWFGPNDDDGGSRWDRFLVTDSTSVPAPRTPAAPWQVTATSAGSGQADIAWSRGGNGGSALSGFIITSSDGPSFTVNDPTAVSFHATGLNNVAQTFTVQAVNALGNSDATAPSAQSNSVTPSVASVPGAPTAATATAGNMQAAVSWTAPASDGGAPITSYTVTSSPGNLTATSTTTSVTFTGLTNGTAYTFTVTATNSAGTGPASSPSNSVTPTLPGSVLYGPDGTEWTQNTVSDGTTFDIIVSSGAELLTAISNVSTAQANAGYRIGIANGTDLAPSTLTIPQSSNLDAATQAVLIRPVSPGGAQFSNSVSLSCSNIVFAYMDVHGNFKWDNGPKNSWLLRCHGVGGSNINVSSGQSDTNNPGGSDCGLVGCVYPDIHTQNGDRIHISPDYKGSGHTPGHAMNNFTIDRSWIEGTIRPAGSTSHADTVQVDGLTGTYRATNTFFGPAGSNGTSQVSADIFWSADGDFCSVVMDTCLLGGTSATSTTTGQGNSSSFSSPDTRSNCVFYNESSGTAFRFNTPLHRAYQGSTTPQVTLTNCTFYGTITGSGTGLTNTNPTMLSASDKGSANPGYVSPPWQWW